MKSGAGDRLSGSTSKTRGLGAIVRKDFARDGGVNSKLYFVKSTKHFVDTIDTRRFAAKEVTVIYLSFTNVRISIALPGGGVSLEGGANAAHGRTSPPGAFVAGWES